MRGSVIRLRTKDDDGEPCTYAQIQDIIVYDNHKIFEVTVLNIIAHDSHCQCMQVEVPETSTIVCCLYSQFHCHGVLHLKQKNNSYYIIEKDNKGNNCF